MTSYALLKLHKIYFLNLEETSTRKGTTAQILKQHHKKQVVLSVPHCIHTTEKVIQVFLTAGFFKKTLHDYFLNYIYFYTGYCECKVVIKVTEMNAITFLYPWHYLNRH